MVARIRVLKLLRKWSLHADVFAVAAVVTSMVTMGALMGCSARKSLEGYLPRTSNPTITIDDVSAFEGQSVVFTVTLSEATTRIVSFNWSTADGTATVGNSDYVTTSGTVTIDPGSTSATLSAISTNDDAIAGTLKYFEVSLSQIEGATAGDTTGRANLADSTNGITISSLSASNITYSSFDVSLSFSADTNANATVTLYYCNATDSSGCDPLSGSSVAMSRGGGVYTASISGLGYPNDPTDTLRLMAVASDSDGAVDSPQTSTVTLAEGPVDTQLGSASITNVSTNGFTVSVSLVGDSNSDGAATMRYCNSTDSWLCNPQINGVSVAMVKTEGTYRAVVASMASPNDPGDQFNIYIEATDPDGVTGSPINTTATLNYLSPVAIIDNAPTNYSDITTLETAIHGHGVVQYQYKIGPAGSTSCSSALGYSADFDIATRITDDISALPDGQIRLCVIGKNAGGAYQALAAATSTTWYKDTSATLTLFIASENYVEVEDNGSFNVIFEMSGTKTYDVVVTYSVVGTLSNGIEYSIAGLDPTTLTGTVTIPAGQITASKTILLYGDSVSESDEWLKIQITKVNTGKVVILGSSSFKLTIIDDDMTRLGVDQIAAGGDVSAAHACGVFAGILRCWGANSYGQLGDGTTNNSEVPVVIDSGVSYQMVSAGGNHTCGITTTGILKCWGRNTAGQIGDASTADKHIPTEVDAGTRYKYIALGLNHSCGITSTGTLRCWGANNLYQLGDGTNVNKSSPVTVNSGTSYTVVALRDAHSCGITTAGILRCWGYNYQYQLGDGTQTTRSTPRTIDTGVSYSKVALGAQHSCGVTLTGSTKCWGTNSHGQLGDASTTTRSTPTATSDASTYADISSYANHSCGLTSAGSIKCWGHNGNGQLGDGTTTSHSSPVAITSVFTYRAVATGYNFACGVTTNDLLYCWGNNSMGQLGVGFTKQKTPYAVDSGITYSKVSVGGSFVCAITTAGDLKCWGNNSVSQVGDGGTTNKGLPVTIDLGTSYQRVSAGASHSCGVTSAGVLKCWGQNSMWQQATSSPAQRATPDAVEIGISYQKMASGAMHSCGITTSGVLKCWGWDLQGQVGNGNGIEGQLLPQIIESGTSYIEVGTGGSHSCGVTSAGALRCWGANWYGQLGDGTTAQRVSPVIVDSGVSYTMVAASGGGGGSSCGITTDGVAKCWGLNNYGQLGVGDATDRWTPTTLNDVGVTYQSISIGGDHGCGVTTSGVLKCWGGNNYGQLGDGTTASNLSPIVIDGGVSYVSVTAGTYSTCGITTASVLKCWGDNRYGQVGTGFSPTDYYLPSPASEANTALQDATELYIYDASASSTPTQNLDISVAAWGDSNMNGSVTVYYCNQTDAPNCDPTSGSSFNLVRGASVFTGSSTLSSPDDAGDVIKVLIRATDADGAYGEYSAMVTLQ